MTKIVWEPILPMIGSLETNMYLGNYSGGSFRTLVGCLNVGEPDCLLSEKELCLRSIVSTMINNTMYRFLF